MTTSSLPPSADEPQPPLKLLEQQHQPLVRLVTTIQELSLARDLETVMQVVRRAARMLVAADGATFVLREGVTCYYAEEDAISPLWKGRRFPIMTCVSGWAMLNRRAVVIEDIYTDPRIPLDAYRPTFVKSLVMVPIRTAAPIGAIGTYWATHRRVPAEEVQVLQALADSTSIAMENVQLYADLEQRVRERTRQLEAANQDLDAFAASVAHDLRSPLSQVQGYSELLGMDYADQLPPQGREYLGRIGTATQRMAALIDDMLRLSRMARVEVKAAPIQLSELVRQIVAELQQQAGQRRVEVTIAEGIEGVGDPRLLRVALENLLVNAWKYTSTREQAQIAFGVLTEGTGGPVYYIRDNGVGFDMEDASKVFSPFQRLHSAAAFPGVGVGLATVQRIIQKHGGRVWVEAAVEQGATFYFTLGGPSMDTVRRP
jgi:signal transduction histidine kinase